MIQNFFLYFEEADFYQRCINIKKKIYLFEEIIIEHEGKGSIDIMYKNKYEIKSRATLLVAYGR